ncbi:NYN domain-containing protein [Loigolactobacillus zhaoyuanensis]|uniref:NYN domain-containing protein n=1 Tax=Loigolactobacillus zhaoyuanensis TaxID=2486017 RepID=A0ABW8UI76_9LACO|nr:NYN domain-containing protein [Loigolactobacillus zhaoyuanensis]
MMHEILIIDGYNVIGNWPELDQLKQADKLADARDELLGQLAEFRKYEDAEIILVFDAMYVPGITQRYDQYNLQVVWTQEDETADSYIEKLAVKLQNRLTQITVVTSDQAEQWTIFSRGAVRISSREFKMVIQRAKAAISRDVRHYHDTDLRRRSPWDQQQLLSLAKLRDNLTNDD